MITGNKGEWSEVYTLLRIISDKQLFAGDSDLKRIENLIFPIIKILRDESKGRYEYSFDKDLVIIKGDVEEFRIPINRFQENASLLLTKLKEKTNTTFSVPEIESFIGEFNCTSLKAKSTSKSDIRIVIHDQRTGTTPQLGFSIKSQLGKPSTLFNSAQGSNFIYKLVGAKLTNEDVNGINEIKSHSKIQDRVKAIIKSGAELEFVRTEGTICYNNLVLIDSLLPQITASMLLCFSTTNYSKLIDLVTVLENQNPLGFDVSEDHKFYDYKIKRLLTDSALGMTASKKWTGELDATGGYLVVKDDGEILCYHIYNRNDFENYLLANTKIINPSSSRLGFGLIYREGEDLFFKLNMQIRFIK